MLHLLKKNTTLKNTIFLKSNLGIMDVFIIDKFINTPQNVKIFVFNDKVFFKGILGKLNLKILENIHLFKKKNKLMVIYSFLKNKKKMINLFEKLIKIKIKGVLQGFKFNLILKGVGFKVFLEKNLLIFKLGYSHPVLVQLPVNVKVVCKGNNLTLNSIDFIKLTQFIYLIKSHKIPEPYKGKGILFKNEKIIRKEGKKSKK
uniref:ribosomal protein L6 n=1 Tax=Paralagenidium karlingii TaxID=1440115 RepID=UPI0026E38606|nr:ribosomal protein L6 [Paralagenidium karlingii]WJH17921.1 ribosomal protein L6 [Paralagenidium karlingii]